MHLGWCLFLIYGLSFNLNLLSSDQSKPLNRSSDQNLNLVNLYLLIPILFLNSPSRRTSDGGNGNHSVCLPIIWIKIKVD